MSKSVIKILPGSVITQTSLLVSPPVANLLQRVSEKIVKGSRHSYCNNKRCSFLVHPVQRSI